MPLMPFMPVQIITQVEKCPIIKNLGILKTSDISATCFEYY